MPATLKISQVQWIWWCITLAIVVSAVISAAGKKITDLASGMFSVFASDVLQCAKGRLLQTSPGCLKSLGKLERFMKCVATPATGRDKMRGEVICRGTWGLQAVAWLRRRRGKKLNLKPLQGSRAAENDKLYELHLKFPLQYFISHWIFLFPSEHFPPMLPDTREYWIDEFVNYKANTEIGRASCRERV